MQSTPIAKIPAPRTLNQRFVEGEWVCRSSVSDSASFTRVELMTPVAYIFRKIVCKWSALWASSLPAAAMRRLIDCGSDVSAARNAACFTVR